MAKITIEPSSDNTHAKKVNFIGHEGINRERFGYPLSPALNAAFNSLSNRIDLLEKPEKERWYKGFKTVDQFIDYLDKRILSDYIVSGGTEEGTTVVKKEKESVFWDDIVDKPGWIGKNKPVYNYIEVGAVSDKVTINGMKLYGDMVIECNGNSENGTNGNLTEEDMERMDNYLSNGLLIGDMIYFNKDKSLVSYLQEVDSGDTIYGHTWEYESGLLDTTDIYPFQRGIIGWSDNTNGLLLYADSSSTITLSGNTYLDKNLTVSGSTKILDKLFMTSGDTKYFEWDVANNALHFNGTFYAEEIASKSLTTSINGNHLLYDNVRINGSAITSATTINIVNSAITAASAVTCLSAPSSDSAITANSAITTVSAITTSSAITSDSAITSSSAITANSAATANMAKNATSATSVNGTVTTTSMSLDGYTMKIVKSLPTSPNAKTIYIVTGES